METPQSVITNIERLPASPMGGLQVIGVSISPTINFYNVIGNNLQDIIDVKWAPRDRKSIQFKMLPFTLYSCNMAQFGIQILDNFCNADNRGGHIQFKRKDGSLIQWAVITYGSLGLKYRGPWSGLREFET